MKQMESRLVRFVQQAMVQVLHSKMTRLIQRDDARQRVRSQDLLGVVSRISATRF